MKAIEKTFEDNKKPFEKHYSKPNVHAVETLNVFPDFKVIFNCVELKINLLLLINLTFYLLELEISMCSSHI